MKEASLQSGGKVSCSRLNTHVVVNTLVKILTLPLHANDFKEINPENIDLR